MINLDVSPELAAYGTELRRWEMQAIRPLARQADTEHALPDVTAKVLDTAPVALDRVDRAGDALPVFPDATGVRTAFWYEQVAYGDIWLSEALNRGVGHLVVQAVGTPEQVERWARPIVEQGGKTGLGMSEPGTGSDTSNVGTTAVRDGDNWVINGSKMYTSLGAIAEYIVVFATMDKSQGRSAIRPFVVEKGTPGLAVVKRNEDKLGLRCWTTSQLAFDHCAVPVENQLGWTGDEATSLTAAGVSAGLAAFNHNRPNVSAMSIGLAQAALDLASDLLVEQRAGFAPHRWAFVESELERMDAALARARRLNLRAQWIEDQGLANRFEASIAKGYGPPTAERVIRRCMQLLGPEGTTEDLLLEKWYRDVKILDIFEGTGQIMRVLISRTLMGRQAAA